MADRMWYLVSYKKPSGWTVVYDGPSKAEAFATMRDEAKLGRTLVCMAECPQ